MLAARALGVGSVLTTFNIAIEDVLRREFGLPDDALPWPYPDGLSGWSALRPNYPEASRERDLLGRLGDHAYVRCS